MPPKGWKKMPKDLVTNESQESDAAGVEETASSSEPAAEAIVLPKSEVPGKYRKFQ